MLLGTLFAQKESPMAARFVGICSYLELAAVAMSEHLYPGKEPLILVFTES